MFTLSGFPYTLLMSMFLKKIKENINLIFHIHIFIQNVLENVRDFKISICLWHPRTHVINLNIFINLSFAYGFHRNDSIEKIPLPCLQLLFSPIWKCLLQALMNEAHEGGDETASEVKEDGSY